MQSKKALIRRMAVVAAGVLVLGLAGVLITLGVAESDREDQLAAARAARARVQEAARSYLEELATRITSVPVDATVVGEIQSAYFAEAPQQQRLVWGVGSDGEFLFGVPPETFARLNQLWDAHQDELTDEGLFVDRTDFLRRLIRLDPREVARAFRERGEAVGELLTQPRWDRESWLTFSTPLRAPDGSALGNLYLETERPRPPVERFEYTGVVAGFGVASGGAAAFLWFLLPTWVFVDARERGVRRASLWSFLVLISLFVGLAVYLIARPDTPGPLHCPACSREVNGGAFCPHCGHDLGRAFCSACRYPLKPEWAFCPSCRTEVGGGSHGASDLGDGRTAPGEV